MDQNNEDNKGIDLSHALDDSSSRVKFEGEQQYARPYYSDTPRIIQLVMKYSGGYIKDEKQANYFLVGFVVVAIMVSLFLLFGFHTKTPKAVRYREDIPSEVRKKLPPGVWETIPSKFQ